MTSSRDPVTAVNQGTPVQPVTKQQLRKVRLVVADNVPREEVRELLEMLGVFNPPAVRIVDEDAAA